MLKNFLFRRQTNILSAASVIAAAILLSRLLGLVKFRLLTDRFTVSDIGVYLAAFRLPSTIFDLIVMGALTSAFIPVFTAHLTKDKEVTANRIASTILNLSFLVSLALSLIFFLFADPLVHLMAPGLTAAEFKLVIPFTRIMLIGQTLPLVLGNFLTGILQSHKRFLVPALAPVAYNLGIIAGIVFLSPIIGLYGAVWGVVLGAILFLLIQIPLSFHLGFRYTPKIDLHLQGVREVGRLIVPRTIGLAITQLNYFANIIISSLLSARAITIFNFAQTLEQVPVSLFAATISQAALPTLSEEQAKGDQLESFKKTFLTSFHQILFLTFPAAAILIVLRIPIVRLVYGASKFDWFATVDTGRTLAFLGVGLIGESLVNLIVRGFFALHDSQTPVIIGAGTVALNICLSILFIPILHWPIWGLAAASAVADSLYATILLFFLHRRVEYFSLFHLFVPAVKMFLAALVTGLSLYIPMKLLDQLVFDTTHTLPLIALTGTASLIGLSVYLFLTWLLDIEELQSFLTLFKKINFRAVSDVVTNESIINT